MLGEVRSARWLPGWYVKRGGEGPGELTLPCSIETKAAAYILKDPQVPSCQSPARVFETPLSSWKADGRGSWSLWAAPAHFLVDEPMRCRCSAVLLSLLSKSSLGQQFHPTSGMAWPSALPFPRTLPSKPQHSFVLEKLQGQAGSIWSPCQYREIFVNTLSLLCESLRVFERNAPNTIEPACLLSLLKI